MALMPPPPPPNPRRPVGTYPLPSDDSDSDSDSDSSTESDTDTATPTVLSPSIPRITLEPDEGISEHLLSQLKSVTRGHSSFANYCCGGSISVTSSPQNSPSSRDTSKAAVTAPPITLRFDTPSGNVSKLSFPPELEDEKGKGKRRVEVEDLLGSCTPDMTGEEKPGRGSRVKGRRSCARLGKEKFSVDIHPNDLGIVDSIKQILLPGFGSPSDNHTPLSRGQSIWDVDRNESWKERIEHYGIRAELYELSVYFSSSSNAQKPFETLPRRGAHCGTLVICLPYGHQGGGQLLTLKDPVTNKSHDTFFPTSSISPTITWAAFPRTSSHSILPITCGHLVTLTYDLHLTEAVGGIMQRYPIADPRLSPLFKIAKGMLENHDFLPKGGTIAHYCVYHYSHTRKRTQNLMPYSLRGIDATIFCAFRTLGLNAYVGPALGDEAWDEWQQVKEERLFNKIYRDSDEDMDVEEREEEDEEEEEGEATRFGTKWHRLKMIPGNGSSAAGDNLGNESKSAQRGGSGVFRVGVDPTNFMNRHYPLHLLRNVIWLNESSDHGWEIATVNLKLGPNSNHTSAGRGTIGEQQGEEENDNEFEDQKEEVELMWQYSHAVILIEIPPLGEKGRTRTSPQVG